jgi:hypothetical protein
MVDENTILNMFPIEGRSIYSPLKIKAGIFTNNINKAERVFNRIYNDNKDSVVRYINGKNDKSIMLSDGTWYVWIKPTLNARGHRCRKAYIDKDIDINTLHDLIIPICIYCTREDVIVI